MYPLLLEIMSGENNPLPGKPFKALKMIIENLPVATVKNGETAGMSLHETIRISGRELLGEKGKETAVFKDRGSRFLSAVSDSCEENADATIYPFGIVSNIISHELLTVDKFHLKGKTRLYEESSFLLVYMLEGETVISYFGGSLRISSGDLVFIPAGFLVEIMGGGDMLLLHV